MSDPIRITDPNDPRVAAYRDVRERDLVGRQGLFVAEGKVVLKVLIDAPGFELGSILVLENRLAGLSDLLDRTLENTPVYIASNAVMDGIAGFPIHRGILAIGRRQTVATAGRLISALPAHARLLVLVGIANHDNLGAIFRNATAFGVDAVLMDATCCDPLYRKSIRVSVGGVFRVPFAAFDGIDDMIEALAGAGVEMIALSPKSATDLRAIPQSRRTALFLGAEGEGLPPALLSRLRTARIPIAPGFDSLNVATAGAIALYHLSLGDTSVS